MNKSLNGLLFIALLGTFTASSLFSMQAVSPAIQTLQSAYEQEDLLRKMDNLNLKYDRVVALFTKVKQLGKTPYNQTQTLEVQKLLSSLENLIQEYSYVREAIDASRNPDLRDALNPELSIVARGINYINNYSNQN